MDTREQLGLLRVIDTDNLRVVASGLKNWLGGLQGVDMDLIGDEDRRRRLRALEERIKDPRSVSNIDCLLDTVQALVADCEHPSVKRMKNIEAYTNRCELWINEDDSLCNQYAMLLKNCVII